MIDPWVYVQWLKFQIRVFDRLTTQVAAQFPEKMECIFTPRRYKVFWGGRGAGRSWGVARALLLMGVSKGIRVLCARELQKSISESVHKLLSDQIRELGLEKSYNIQQNKIFGPLGTEFFFEGIKNNVTTVKSMEGIDYCWVEEANKVSKASWTVLIPTIRKNGSEIWLTFNPELETDYTYKRFVLEADESRSFVVHMTWRDNPWFPQELREEMLRDKEKDEDLYNNIWEGRCVQQLEGAVYAKELRKLYAEGRVMRVPYDRSVPVDAFWDLGRRHNTSIWLGQRVAMQYRVLEGFQDKGEDVPYYLKELQRREYTYGTMYLPHDAKAKKLGMKITIQEQIGAVFKVRIVPKLGLADGIMAAKMFMNACVMDENLTTDGRYALSRYRYKVAPDGQYSKMPREDDDEADYAAAFRYMSIAASGAKRGKQDMKQALVDAAQATREFLSGQNNAEMMRSRRERNPGQDWMR